MITNIDDIKAAADIVEVIGDYVKLKRDGANMTGLCPFHSEKTPSFSVSKAKNIYKCFGCGKSGDVIDFICEHERKNYIEAIKIIAHKYNIEIQEGKVKEYAKPVPRLEKLSPKTLSYLEGRGISNNTLLRFGITESVEHMPKSDEPVNTICFNYFRDEALVNIKYRDAKKSFKLEKNAELIFYNIDAIKDETECIITEGEIDCLSVHECGVYPVVSVPNGASIGNLQLKYLDNSWQYFENKTKIILLTDADEAGNRLREELARRLGRDRCYKAVYPEGCKDINDTLVKHGKGMVISVIEQAAQWPIEGIVDAEVYYPEVEEYYKNGMPPGAACGIPGFDDLLTFMGGQFTTVTGAPGSGKSEVLDYISTSLTKTHGWKWGVASFENPVAFHVTKLMEKFAGLAFNFRKNPLHRMTHEQFEQSVYMVDAYYSFVNVSQADVSIPGILSKFRELVLRKGCKGFIIDPWNYLEHKQPLGQTETQYTSEALSLIKEFCVQNDAHVFLVVHPRKLMKDPATKKTPVATMYDISGSAHFFNKTDNGISVHREDETVDIHVQKVRFSWTGRIGYASFNFDTFTRQYKPI